MASAIMDIPIHPLTHDPTAAWNEMKNSQRVIVVDLKPPRTKVAFNKARIVCMSDTHSLTQDMRFDVPGGDIFIHAGDFTKCGQLEEVVEFNNWIGSLPHKHKVVIAGNHELSFDKSFTHPFIAHSRAEISEHKERALQIQNVRDVLTNCTYIEDELVEIYGIQIYGSPWQPEFCNWAFNLPRGRPCLEKWQLIPAGIDILVTHGPPIGHGDLCCSGVRAGCVELLTTVQQRVKPQYHIFGHVHEGYGVTSDGRVIYVNASTCDVNYVPNNPPIVFDISLQPGMRKEDY